MPLAGRVRRNTVLAAFGAVFALGATGAFVVMARRPKPPPVVIEAVPLEPVAAEIAPAPTPPANPVVVAQAARAADEATLPGLREVDRLILLDFRGKAIGTDKIKDATRGKPYKVNVYQDAGQRLTNRVKVDLDRDEKWDEKWTFEPDGAVTRQIAPNDDEKYTVTEVFDGKAFVAAP